MDEQTLNKRKKINKVVLIVLLTVFALITMITCLSSSDTEPEYQLDMNANWDSLTTGEREVWIKAYCEKYAYNDVIDQLIKKQIAYPRTVKYDRYPSLGDAYITQPDSGWVFLKGSGTASNAFNVPVEFTYTVKLTITSEKVNIDKVIVQ